MQTKWLKVYTLFESWSKSSFFAFAKFVYTFHVKFSFFINSHKTDEFLLQFLGCMEWYWGMIADWHDKQGTVASDWHPLSEVCAINRSPLTNDWISHFAEHRTQWFKSCSSQTHLCSSQVCFTYSPSIFCFFCLFPFKINFCYRSMYITVINKPL